MDKRHKVFLGMMFAFLVFGLLMIANSTVISSKNLYGDPYKFVSLQLGWVIIGLVGFFLLYNFDYRKLYGFAYALLIINIIFLLFLGVVGLFPCSETFALAPCINGANRWLYINPPPLPEVPFLGVLGFQPGELAKISIILYLSVQLSKNIKKKEELFWVYFIVSALLSGLILLQPNMSTAAMVFALGTIIYFVSGAPIKPLLILIPVVTLLVAGVILISPYRRQRLITLLSSSDEDTSSYHIKQALVALGSGGITGVGLGQSKQKFQYLPEVASDSIFAIIGEELGFIGTSFLVLTFLYFVYLGFLISRDAPDLLGKLLGIGVSSWIGIQFFINVAAMTKIIPLTGVPIPLISYGGSSMVFSLMGLGILANISKQS